MEEEDCYLGVEQESLEKEAPQFECDNAVNDRHVFDEKPVRLQQFYFIKYWPLEDFNTDNLIKQAEKMIEKMTYDQTMIDQKLRDKRSDSWQVSNELSRIQYYDCATTQKWQRDKLNILHLKLDKLSFANNAYKGKPIHSCLSAGEVDKQKLCFLMRHGCRNLVDEKKLFREVNACQKNDGGTTINELQASIHCLENQLYTYWGGKKNIDVDRQKEILEEIKQLEMATEKIVSNAAVNGKLWNSLGSKKTVQAEVLCNKSEELRERQLKVRAKVRKLKKELELIEKDIQLLQKHLEDTNRKKNEAYNTILKLKKLYGEENASYYQNRLLLKKVKTLAEKKDIAALQELSKREVETFMSQWNSCIKFRDDYKKRVLSSLSHRNLCIDGRMTNTQKPQIQNIKPQALSKTRLKWLMKDHLDSSEHLSF